MSTIKMPTALSNLGKLRKLSDRERSHKAVSGATRCAKRQALRAEQADAFPDLLTELEAWRRVGADLLAALPGCEHESGCVATAMHITGKGKWCREHAPGFSGEHKYAPAIDQIRAMVPLNPERPT